MRRVAAVLLVFSVLAAGLWHAWQVPSPSPGAPLPPAPPQEDVLWLARAIYSETKRPEEQRLVAWVVRSRVETEYRGAESYKEAVLDPYQFSAFNPGSRKRPRFLELDERSRRLGWQSALERARGVLAADSAGRPLPPKTRHFYSERSLRHGAPDWAADSLEVEVPWVKNCRFRFYRSVR